VLLAVLTMAPACGRSTPGGRRVAIAAASDLRGALDDVAAACRRVHPDIALSATYGSSGNFVTQIRRGAPFDLFLSADDDYPRQLVTAGRAVRGSGRSSGCNRIATSATSSLGVPIERGLQAIADDGRLAIANPEHAPYGRAAIAALRGAGVLDRVQPRLIYGENVAQAVQFARSGAADAGLVALSLVASSDKEGRYWPVPADLYPPLRQAGVIVTGAADLEAARTVCAFLVSADARSILARHGFGLPEAQ